MGVQCTKVNETSTLTKYVFGGGEAAAAMAAPAEVLDVLEAVCGRLHVIHGGTRCSNAVVEICGFDMCFMSE